MCDTFLALQPVTEDGAVLFGKNSDREPNEAQILEYQPAQVFSAPQTVQCTYRAIAQVKTRPVSRYTSSRVEKKPG